MLAAKALGARQSERHYIVDFLGPDCIVGGAVCPPPPAVTVLFFTIVLAAAVVVSKDLRAVWNLR
jgi:hypothetical protein